MSIDSFRKQVDQENAKHREFLQQTHDFTLNSLQTGLKHVFEQITQFNAISLKSYEELSVQPGSQSLPQGNGEISYIKDTWGTRLVVGKGEILLICVLSCFLYENTKETQLLDIVEYLFLPPCGGTSRCCLGWANVWVVHYWSKRLRTCITCSLYTGEEMWIDVQFIMCSCMVHGWLDKDVPFLRIVRFQSCIQFEYWMEKSWKLQSWSDKSLLPVGSLCQRTHGVKSKSQGRLLGI